MAKVILQGVWKSYPGNVDAVKDFNLEIQDKEFVVFVGPSGCGKSTTLRMVAGLEEISKGTITIGDRVVNDTPPKDRDIAMVFQNYALYPHMTVYENMAFGLKMRKFSKQEIDQRVRFAAGMLGLESYLERRPKALSGGQRQRVALGRAIVRKPAVFLFDEPLSNLDAKMRLQMRVELIRLHRKLETTMIYVTHDQVEAMTMGDRIVVMKEGVIQQVATPIALYDHPANRFVAGFIGTPPMNFFEGQLAGEGNGICFHQGRVSLKLTEARAKALAAYKGRAIVLGIRPEDIGSSQAESTPGMPRIQARIEVIEPMGSESYVYLNTGTHTFVSRVDSHRRFSLDQEADMAVMESKMHFFDPATEQAIV